MSDETQAAVEEERQTMFNTIVGEYEHFLKEDGTYDGVISAFEAAIRADERARYEGLVRVARALPHDTRCPAAYTAEDRCECSRAIVRDALAALEGGTE